jgi:serine/threonine protein kinase
MRTLEMFVYMVSNGTIHTKCYQVALKELKILQSDEDTGANEEWDREARALRAINRLDHPHVIRCIAAIRRGGSRYFMFPWAEGDSLRDYWNKTQTRGPSHKIIEETVTQLLGIVDALAHFHDYREGYCGKLHHIYSPRNRSEKT